MRAKLALGASLLTAIIASLCCIGPLVVIVLGLGTFGAAAAFQVWRPYLLGATFALLAAAFYLTYSKREVVCTDGGPCVTRPSVDRWNRALLWLATGFIIALATFPYYSRVVWAILLPLRKAQAVTASVTREAFRAGVNGASDRQAKASRNNQTSQARESGADVESKPNGDGRVRIPPTSAAETPGLARLTFEIRGMTCAGCAISVEQSLGEIPGVQSVRASFEQGRAEIEYNPARVSLDQLRAAISNIGYEVVAVHTNSRARSAGRR